MNEIIEAVNRAADEAVAKIAAATDSSELEAVRIAYLGRNGLGGNLFWIVFAPRKFGDDLDYRPDAACGEHQGEDGDGEDAEYCADRHQQTSLRLGRILGSEQAGTVPSLRQTTPSETKERGLMCPKLASYCASRAARRALRTSRSNWLLAWRILRSCLSWRMSRWERQGRRGFCCFVLGSIGDDS